MASSSSFSPNKYDVFLSFRGGDTRDNFTSHLYAALCQKQIQTFIDNQLIRGDEISPSLLNAIEQSKIAVVILSEGYASSRWCLKELVKILKCKNKYGQIVIPVFYGVNPSDVRNQTGTFGDGFSKLEKRFMERVEKLQKWRNALREAASVSGFDSHVIRSESVLVQKIVEDILKRLNDMFPTELDKDFVGIESRIKKIESLLSYNSTDIHTLGIWGIGGIGKTTIARAIFNKFSDHFDGCCFIPSIREESMKNGGLAQLHRELFSSLLGDENLNNGIPNFNFASRRIGRKKVLIVFDDVTSAKQIKSLIKNLDWFGKGSLILITTRNKQVLQNCRVKIKYEMKELENDNAFRLFIRHAFNRDQPDVGYEELSYKVIQYCCGVPLALEVLGCFLFEKSEEDWESAIKKLKKIPHSEIQNILKISYDELDDEEQNIFLDIAYFVEGEDRDFVIKFLDACGFHAKIGLRVLEDKCLIKLSYNKIIMHDLLQEMGKEIVRQECVNDPGKRSRLCHPEEIYEVLEDNTGTETIQGISLNMSKVKEMNLNFDIFKKMPKLRFLKFYKDNKLKICDFEGSRNIFSKLRVLHWEGYPLKLLPQNIRAENLVLLNLRQSKIEQLWNGVQNLVNLKEIVLTSSKNLMKLPDLSKAQNLERLSLGGCKSLNTLPSSIGSESLKKLFLSGCSNLKRLPEILSCNLEGLYLEGTAIEELPSFIEYQSRLVVLDLRQCSRLEILPSSLCKLKSLSRLCLNDCSNLRRLPDELGNLEALRELNISRTLIRDVPSSILCLSNLKFLYLSGLREHKNDFISSISSSFVGLHELSLTDCGITELPESLGQLSSLRYLNLSENNFERFPECFINLSKLLILDLSYCQRLQSLPRLPCSLNSFYANNCTSLESISCLSFLFKPLKSNEFCRIYDFKNCYKLEGDELRKIVEDSLQKIQLMENSKFGGSKYISFPGSEIPEWFKNQSMESSITLKPSPPDHQKVIGFAFCLIVAFEEHHYSEKYVSLFYNLKFKTGDGNRHFYRRDQRLLVDFGCVDSDHVLLGYQIQTDMISDFAGNFSDINEVFIEFYLNEKFNGKRINCCTWLKKCGIHLLFAHDYGESVKDWGTSFSTILPRKRKRKRNEIFN